MKYELERGRWQETFAEFLESVGLTGYGFLEDSNLEEYETDRGGFENDIFLVNPYFWGSEDMSYEEELEISNQPNFIYKPTGLMIDWYKYPLRSATCNQSLSFEAFEIMLNKCKASIDECTSVECTHSQDKESLNVDEANILCSNCKEEIHISSVCQRAPHSVEISFSYPYCGCCKRSINYLYTDK